MAKVLVGVATFDGMKYCEDEFYNRVRELSYLDYDVLIVDNSRSEEYSDKLRGKFDGLKVIYDDTDEEKSIFRLISSRNKILEYGLEKGYTHILMLDSDVIPPKDIIEELLRQDKAIVSGVYYNYFNISGKIQYHPVAWAYFSEKEFAELKKVYPDFVGSKTRKDIKRYLTEDEVESGDLMGVAVPSGGAMLIRREVFESSKDDSGEPNALYGKDTKEGTGEDIYFINRVRELGFEPYCYPKVKCEHLVQDKYKKDENGNYVHSSFSDLVKV